MTFNISIACFVFHLFEVMGRLGGDYHLKAHGACLNLDFF